MVKARFVLLGIVCVILVTLTSISVACASATTYPSPHPCSIALKGTRIRLWPYGPVTTRVLTSSFSYVMHGTYLDKWSTRSPEQKQALYAVENSFRLWIDGKPVPLSVDVCYSAADDTSNKLFYVQFYPFQWKAGPHTFHGLWGSVTGTEPRFTQYTVIVTFASP